MAEKEWMVLVLFSDFVHTWSVQRAIQELRDMKFGSVFPLSVKNLYIGVIISGVKENLLDQALSDFSNLNFVRFADILILPQKINPPKSKSSCSLKKDR